MPKKLGFLMVFLSALVLLLGVMSQWACQQTVDTVEEELVVVANGNILTMNPDQPTASAMAVKGGKIIEVGDLDAVKETVGSSYEYVDPMKIKDIKIDATVMNGRINYMAAEKGFYHH